MAYQRDDWRDVKPHEAAEMFPLMSEGQVGRLADGMRRSGYDRDEPVILYQGKILDGRNRMRMCDLSGVEPWFVDFEGDEEEAYQLVWRKNAGRRDLTRRTDTAPSGSG